MSITFKDYLLLASLPEDQLTEEKIAELLGFSFRKNKTQEILKKLKARKLAPAVQKEKDMKWKAAKDAIEGSSRRMNAINRRADLEWGYA
jgi:hypothetical protein